MILEINTTSDKDKAIIEKFYNDHYDAPQYLKPTIQSIKNEPKNKKYFMYLDGVNILAFFSLYQPVSNYLLTSSTVVHKDFRGQGMGKKINDYIEQYAKENNAQKITCHIYVDNLPSIMLKLKRGYLIEGLLRNHDIDGQHEYILSKEL